MSDNPDEAAAVEMAARIHEDRAVLRSTDACHCRNCRKAVVSQLWVWRDGVTYLWFPGGKWNHVEHGWTKHPAVAYPLRADTRVLRTGDCRRCRSAHLHVWNGSEIRVHVLGPSTRGQIVE